MPAESVGARLGATPLGHRRTRFHVWAPHARRVEVVLDGGRRATLAAGSRGYHSAVIDGVSPGARFRLSLDGGEPLPDPASAFQPDGVHGPSEVVDPRFDWSDTDWPGIPLAELVIYELHVGTFSAEGTFDGVLPHLTALRELGVTALEIMPVAQFPGTRNWGYDGVLPFAVQNSYGGPAGLKRLVDACHRTGMAVLLDVVYNHLGPEGNHLARFGPYFTGKYHTPWGDALNFDEADSDEVRRYFIENALRWIDEFHMDGLRLDAVHAIHDMSARPFLRELCEVVSARAEALGRRVHLIAETDLNDVRMVQPPELGGIGMDAQWLDDFHHALHTLLTDETDGYYQDYGEVLHLARAYRHGFVYAGEYSRFRRRRYGSDSTDIPAERLVVCTQNHDQVGNRATGDRLSALVPFEALRLAAAAMLVSPYTPLLFMGEEYGERRPFPYFVSHTDRALVEAVRRGRREEFAGFDWRGDIPDPQAEETFRSALLDHSLKEREGHRGLYRLYAELLRLRRTLPALAATPRGRPDVMATHVPPALLLHRQGGGAEAACALNFGPAEARLELPWQGSWQRRLDTADAAWDGPGAVAADTVDGGGELRLAPWSAALYERRH
jgi:maltooligosyltrehalose trehalohydrolase